MTALFKTRQVDQIATIEVLWPNGQIEALSGTSIHPIWSVDRQDWIELSELQEGERLQAADGEAVVLSATIHQLTTPVYNIEVHGEHVYQVNSLVLLVHNASPARCAMIAEYGAEAMKGWQAAHIVPKNGWNWAPEALGKIISKVTKEGLIDDVANLFASTPKHAGTHTKAYIDDLIDVMWNRNSRESMIEGMNILWGRIKGNLYQ